MGRFASNKGGAEFQQAPIGTHVARCIKLIDLGTQRGEYQGKVTLRNQVLVSWELPLELMSDGEMEGKPFIVSKFYTNSLNEKATLRQDLVTWRGREFTAAEEAQFDLEAIVGKPCMISVIHNEHGKAKVSAVMSMPKGQTCPPQVNPSFTLWLDADEFDHDKFDSLSDGLKEIIKKSPEYSELYAPKTGAGNGQAPSELENDIPF